MSEVAIGRQPQSENAFGRGTMIIIAAVGTLAFVAMLVLGAYAPDLRSGKNGGAHALSNAGTGFSGLVRLAEATGRNPQIVRHDQQLSDEALVVITPEDPGTNLTDVLERRTGKATLIVLPKWLAQPDKNRPGWVHVVGPMPSGMPEGVLAPQHKYRVDRAKSSRAPLASAPQAPSHMRFFAPPVVQGLKANSELTPLVWDSSGRILLGQIGHLPLYVLADPDLIDNHGIADARQAQAALAMLDFLNSTDADQVLFDVTLNGLGSSRSPLRLAFDPPFLAVTLAIFTALLLAAIQGVARFGSPQRPVRAIAFGKAALVDNSAALVRKAGREASLGHRYVDLMRERVTALFRLPAALKGEVLDERLDRLHPDRRFTEIASATANARTRGELLGEAQALHRWVEEIER